MRTHLLTRVVAVVLAFSSAASAQPPADPDVARLRTLFFQRDYETGVLEGAKLARAHPGRTDVKAWYILNMARADRADEAADLARQMTAAAPNDGWAWVALAAALNYQGDKAAEAVAAGAKAFELLPENPDASWIRAQTLANDPKRREEAIAFVDAQRARLKNPAEILTTKAYALYVLSSAATPRDETKLKAAFESFAEARQADPANVNARYLAGSYLTSLKRREEAYDLLKQAVALAPGSRDVHRAYWTAINGHPTLTADQKNAEIAADLAPFLEKQGNRPGALLTASYGARDLNQPDRQREIEDRLLKDFNDSREAEWVLIDRMREYGRTPEGSKKPEYRQMLREYVARAKHYREGLLGEAYRDLFFVLVEDPAVSSVELLHVADGMTRYETTNVHISYVAAALALADRKIHLDKAEQIARGSIAALTTGVERQRSFYKSDQEFQDRLKRAPAIGYDALGWVLFTKGRMDEAQKEMLKANELDPGNRTNLHHLGRYYEAQNDVERAEEFYVKGIAIQSPGTNPSAAALRALYERRHGSADGYASYVAGIHERDRITRREKIMATRVFAPERVAGFRLTSLDGTPVTLDSLKGKVVVINFWGIWCGWCVRELPDFQKLHEKYAGDPAVAVLTINNDQNPGDVPPWMKQKNYTFGVLLDDGYVSRAGVHAFPTTWFLDGDSRKVFEKVGWSEKLLEEFSWRVDALRASATPAASGGK